MSRTVRSRRIHSPLFALSLAPLIALASRAWAAPVLPSGGVVVGGQARIGAPGGSSLTVSQGSAKAIIDWGSFSIGQGGTVRFDNGSGATLNRVTGQELSSIDGLLSASGSVYLLNPNGVVIGKGGVVKVGGSFVASTLDVSNGAFLTGGDLSFIGSSTAKVINLGKVGALGGDVVLMASAVRNEGAVTAAKGDVGLVAGARVLLRDQALDGGRFTVLVGGAGTRVTNSGSISAAMVELRANGGDVYALAGDTSGVIRATGVSAREGRVFLTAGDSGSVTLGGTVAARGPNGAGGAIETSAGKVSIGSARIDAGPRGSWLLDPNDLTIDQTAANTIATTLNGGTSVTQQTTAAGTGGSGDINVAANVSLNWTTNAGLTLSAYRNVSLGAASTLGSSGGGAVTLYADNTGTGMGTVGFGSGAKVSTSAAVNIFYDPASNPAGSAINSSSYASGTDYSAFVTGGGTVTAYMLVNTLNDLQDVQNNLSGIFALGSDIEARSTATWNGGAGFQPIGPAGSTPLSGTFNGQGHTISNLYITSAAAGVGLFAVVGPTGRIRNLNLDGSVAGGFYTGALVGDNYGSVSNVVVAANVSGGGGVGGIVGVGERGSVLTGSTMTAAVTGAYDDVGGLIGVSLGSVTTDTASGQVKGRNNVGGLVGYSLGLVDHSAASGAVSGLNMVGGLVGVSQGDGGGSIQNSYASGQVGGTDEIGGLVGISSGLVANDHASGSVGGTKSAGGLVGGNQGYPNSQVQVGGGSIENSYATGAVGGATAGGVVGTNDGSVTNVYATGRVGGATAGGVVGLNQTFGVLTNAYWDVSTTTQGGGIGVNQGVMSNVTAIGDGAGVNPYAQSTYGGFDFSASGAWVIFDGATRPILRSEASSAITNAHQLQLIDLNRAAAYTLGADIDLGAVTDPTDVWNPQVGFVPIASRPGAADPFVGTLDGQGHTISALRIISTYDDVGLFGNIGTAGVVRNLTLTNFNVTGANNVGALVGSSLGMIDRVTATNGVNSAYGYVILSDVSGRSSVGGLVGSSLGTISNSSTAVTVLGAVGCSCQFAGGLVGYASGPILNSSATGTVSGYQYVGGLGGRVMDVSNSYATGAVTGAYHDLGGLVGQAFGTLSKDYASGSVTATGDGAQNVGGLVGYLNGSGVISSDYADGKVSTVNGVNVGGLVGTSDGTIANGYAVGPTTGNYGVGGLVGLVNGGKISNVYASGNVQDVAKNGASGPSGGLVGYTGADGPSLIDAYWDTTTTHQATVVGSGFNLNQTGVTGISSPSPSGASGPSPYARATYAGFDFSSSGLWVIFEGSTRPMLRSEATASITNAHQLQLMQLNLAGTYTLGADVDVGAVLNQNDVWNPATGFVPIGSPSGGGGPFTGSLSSLNQTISGLYINRPTSNGVGLFGVIGVGGGVDNITLKNTSVTGGYYTGMLAGDNFGTVSNSAAGGSASGAGGVGGLIGVGEYGSSITNSYSYQVDGKRIELNQYPTYTNAIVSGTGDDVGGLVGSNLGTIVNSEFMGQVSGHANVGGLVGLNAGSITTSSSYQVSVAGADAVGGSVGRNDGVITSDDAAGSATLIAGSSGYAGGLVGRNNGSVAVSSAGGSAMISGGGSAGGLIGLNSAGASVTDSYAAGPSNVAALIGRNDGAVSRAYASGAVGANGAGVTTFNDGTLTDVVWDVAMTGTAIGVASGAGATVNVLPIGGSTGRDPSQPSSYPGFDFTNVWSFAGARPYLLNSGSTLSPGY